MIHIYIYIYHYISIYDRNAFPMNPALFQELFPFCWDHEGRIPMALAGIHLPWLTPKYSTESPPLKTGPAIRPGDRAWTPIQRRDDQQGTIWLWTLIRIWTLEKQNITKQWEHLESWQLNHIEFLHPFAQLSWNEFTSANQTLELLRTYNGTTFVLAING